MFRPSDLGGRERLDMVPVETVRPVAGTVANLVKAAGDLAQGCPVLGLDDVFEHLGNLAQALGQRIAVERLGQHLDQRLAELGEQRRQPATRLYRLASRFQRVDVDLSSYVAVGDLALLDVPDGLAGSAADRRLGLV